jgi:hypothetical protein
MASDEQDELEFIRQGGPRPDERPTVRG